MKIDLKKLNGVYGSKIPFSGSVDLSGEELYGAHPFQHPAQYEGEIVNHLGVLTLSGTIKALYSTCCSRCLKPLDVLLTAQVETVLSREGSEGRLQGALPALRRGSQRAAMLVRDQAD